MVPSYNNAANTVAVLDSIFLQDHSDFEVILIDDASTDGTGILAERYREQHNLQDRLTVVINKHRQRKMRNIYIAIHKCPDEAIVFQHDGDDILAHNHVLSDLDQLYRKNNVWLTYGKVRNIPKHARKAWKKPKYNYGQEIPKRIIEERKFREYPFYYSQPRSHYAWLFKRIKLEDLITLDILGFEGDFYTASNDNAFMFPMLEMAYKHFAFIGDIGYLKNIDSPLVGWKVDKTLQKESANEIRKRQRYKPLNEPEIVPHDFTTAQVDLIFLSENPGALKKSLLFLQKSNLRNINPIVLFSGKGKKRAYQKLSQRFPAYTFTKVTKKHNVQQVLFNTKESNYAMVCDDTAIQKINDEVAISACLEWLEKTHAYTFCLCDLNPMREFFLDGDMYGLQFRANKNIKPHRLGSIYRKKDLAHSLYLSPSHSVKKWIKRWKAQLVDPKKVALYRRST